MRFDSHGKKAGSDTLRVYRTWPDNDTRPTEFAAGAGSKFILSEFKREKK